MLASGHGRCPPTGVRARTPRDRGPPDTGTVHCSLVPPGHDPLCPRSVGRRGRPIRRSGAEEPAVGRENTLRMPAFMEHLLPEDADRPRRCSARTSTCAKAARRNGVATFYDTFDGRLHADGVTLRHADGRLDAARPRDRRGARGGRSDGGAAAVHSRPARAPARAPRGRDRDARADCDRPGAGRRPPVAVLNEDAKTVVRLMVEDARVTTTAVRGYEGELERVASAADGGDAPARRRGGLAAGGRPAGTSAKLDLSWTPTSPPPRPPRPSSPACSR